ncbi:MAG: molybdenum ABC transporter ATP-binding protein [Candidatus Bipolaricaulia bacterium]
MNAAGLSLKLRVRKRLGVFLLDVNAEIDDQATGIFGPSGSGKTTLLNCISGLLTPDQGEIWLGERPLYSDRERVNLRPEDRRVGYVFQEGLLFPHLSVRRNLFYGYRSRRRRDGQASSPSIAPDGVIEVLEIGDLLDRKPDQLSGGQRQRVALGRALIMSPQLLLLDEPLTGLDVGLRGRILPYLLRVRDEFSIPFLYVSHLIADLIAIADEVLVLEDGQAIAQGDPYLALCQPAVLSIAKSSGIENILTLPISDHDREMGLTQLTLGDQTLAVLCDLEVSEGTVTVSIRAEDIILAQSQLSGISARNVIAGVVGVVETVGELVIVFVDVAGARLIAEITPDALEELELREGRPIFLVIKTHAIRVLS